MRKLLLLFATIMLLFSTCYSQIAEYNKLTYKGTFYQYITKSGDTLSIGDTIQIRMPSSDMGYMYILQVGNRCGTILIDKHIVVTKLKTLGSSSKGFVMGAQFKGYGLPISIIYESALEVEEIMNPFGKLNRDQAIAKLKEAKELLDLELLTQKEYDKLKEELSPIILKKK